MGEVMNLQQLSQRFLLRLTDVPLFIYINNKFKKNSQQQQHSKRKKK